MRSFWSAGDLEDRLQLLSEKGLSPQQIEKVTEMAFRELKLEEMRKRRLQQLEEEDEIFISSRTRKIDSVSNSAAESESDRAIRLRYNIPFIRQGS